MRTRLKLVAATLGFLAGIATIGVLGYSFYLDELYPPPPPEVPDPLDGPVARIASRVVIVVFDSTREDLMNNAEVMPNVAALAAKGRRGISMTQPVTMTLLSVLNFSTGRTPGLAWSVHNFQADTFPDESIFYWAHAHGLRSGFTGDAAWGQLFGPWASFDHSFQDGGMYDEVDGLLARKDHEAIGAAHTLLGATEPAFDIVVIHLISTDHIAHATGALTYDATTGAPTPYATTAAAADAAFGELYALYERPGDVWVAFSDHGATDTGNHGGGEDITRRAPFAAAGAGIRPGPPIEIALNAWAPTVSLLLGLPIPRTAEQPAAFELITIDDAQREAALAHHAARRHDFVSGIALSLGAEQDLVASHAAADSAQPERALADSNAVVSNLRNHRRGLQVLGLLLGGLLHLLLLLLLARGSKRLGDEAVGRTDAWSWGVFVAVVAVWMTLMSVPLVYDTWLFKFAEVLGHATESGWKLGRGLLYAGIGTILIAFCLRRLAAWRGAQAESVRVGLVWLAFAVATLATSQVVVKWPFGPLAKTYLTLFVWLAACGGVWVWRRGRLRAVWALATLGVAWMVAVFLLTGDQNLQLMAETSLSRWLVLVTSSAAVLVLGAGPWRREHDSRGRWTVFAALASMLLAMVVYRLEPTPSGARVALLALLAAAVATTSLRHVSRRSRRDLVFALALSLTHVMSSDWLTLMTTGLLAVVYALSEVPLPTRSWTPAVIAAVVGVLDIGYFYVCGYRFSFTAMDVRVVFMLDQTQIDLFAGFLLFTLQHSPIWLILWAAALTNRLEAGDERGLRVMFIAVVGIFFIRTWGPYFAMDSKILNHWFVSHAVPMYIMSTVEFAMAAFWFAVSALGMAGLRPLAAPAPRPRIGSEEPRAESTAAR